MRNSNSRTESRLAGPRCLPCLAVLTALALVVGLSPPASASMDTFDDLALDRLAPLEPAAPAEALASSSALSFQFHVFPENVLTDTDRSLKLVFLNEADGPGRLVRDAENDDRMVVVMSVGSDQGDLVSDPTTLSCTNVPPDWDCWINLDNPEVAQVVLQPLASEVWVQPEETLTFEITGAGINGQGGLSRVFFFQLIDKKRAKKPVNIMDKYYKTVTGAISHDDLADIHEDNHHTRYTDDEAWQAVLDRDGAGSTLDADLVDGEEVIPRIVALEGAVAVLQADVAALQDLLQHFSRNGNEVMVTGANFSIRNGSGSTNSINGLGNLIVGYNEGGTHTGSHMVVAGRDLTYSGYGGVIAGYRNTAQGNYSSVLGGYYNTAYGTYSTVAGGYGGYARGSYGSVSGGYRNTAYGTASSVNGGYYNTAYNSYSSILGGYRGYAYGYYSTVAGGYYNTAYYYYSAVGGGYRNQARGYYSAVSGGLYNTAYGSGSSVSGGYYGTAYSSYAAISGGYRGYAYGSYSSVNGGYYNTAYSTAASVLGGYRNTAYSSYSAVAGGYYNQARGSNSAVAGGYRNTASGSYSAVSGGSYRTATGTYNWTGGTYSSSN